MVVKVREQQMQHREGVAWRGGGHEWGRVFRVGAQGTLGSMLPTSSFSRDIGFWASVFFIFNVRMKKV